MNLRRPLIALLAASVLAGCGGLSNSPTLTPSPNTTTPTTSASASLLTVDPQTVLPSLISELAQVEELARAWRPDAQFYATTVSWPADLSLGRARRVYIFGSASVPTDWWTMAVNEQTNERMRALIPKEDYLGVHLPPMARQYWKIDALTALQTAEKAGGTAFRAAHPSADVTGTLAHLGPRGWLWWGITYRGAGEEELSVRIHPASGEVYNEQGELITSKTSS